MQTNGAKPARVAQITGKKEKRKQNFVNEFTTDFRFGKFKITIIRDKEGLFYITPNF